MRLGEGSGDHPPLDPPGSFSLVAPKADPPWTPPRIIKVPSPEAMSHEFFPIIGNDCSDLVVIADRIFRAHHQVLMVVIR